LAIIKQTYKDQVIEHIYNLILSGELNPGDQVKESHLSSQMGISRAPIREALKELIANGIIEYKTHVGNFVHDLNPQEIIHNYTTRGVLEGFALMQSCDEFSKTEIEKLGLMTDEMQIYAEKGDNKKVTDIGGEFHDLLLAKNKNQQLINFSNSLSLKLHILFYKNWGKLYTPKEIKDRHQEILNAVKKKDNELIEKVVRNHYIETGQKIAKIKKIEG
jgi:DNA-binding GntR family transcriptional regulator